MKQKIYYFLLTALFGLFGMNTWAQELTTTVIDGTEYYEIGNADDLVAFAGIVNGGETTACAVLTDNIDCSSIDSWNSIGNNDYRYKGTFNGQGHIISNLTISSSNTGEGIFYTTAGVTLKNFIVDSSCSFTTSKDCIGLVGKHVGGGGTDVSTFSCLGCAATIKSTGSENPAGLIGGCWGNKDVDIIIEKCWTSGTITSSESKKSNCGAFIGWLNGGKLQVNNSWSIATVETAADAKYLVRAANNSNTAVSFSNCCSLNGTQVAKLEGLTAADLSDLSTGGLTYALNGNSSENPTWFQKIGTDAYPVADNTHGIVYMNGQLHCNGTMYDGTSYSNENLGMTQDDHDFAEGFCTYCSFPDETFMKANEEGNFEIGTAYQLKWFAAYVNQINPTANAVLTADIDMTDVEWTPIGKNVAYGGTFDGKDFTISNFNYVGSGDYNGLFGKVVKATIKNFSVSGALVCAGQGNGTIGWGEGALISNVHSALTITTPASGAIVHGGGIIGDARYGDGAGSTVEYCSFSGTLSVNADSHDCFAGIVGYVNDYCLIDGCANYGTISYAKSNCYIGGILGYVNNTNCYGTHNCLNIGEVTYVGEGDPSYGGAIVGRLRGNDPEKWGNSYWKQGSATQACGENSISKTFEVTAEQLASGEVAYNLGTAFRQNLGEDVHPVLDQTHGIVKEIGEAGYATMYIAEAVQVPEGVEVSTGSINEETQNLTLNPIAGVVPAWEPVVLKGEPGFYSFMPAAAEQTDELTWDGLGLNGSNSNYIAFSGATFASSAEYAGTASSGSGKYIQLRTKNSNEGIVTTTSGGKLKSVTISFNSQTIDRSIKIYGKNEPYTDAADLYNAEKQGTLIGTVAANDKTFTVTPSEDFEYVGMVSSNGAIYIDGITVEWEGSASNIAGNVLKGAAEDIEAAGKYVLAKPEGNEVGFYLATSGTIAAGKAYLEVESGIKAFFFGEAETGISEVNDVKNFSGAIYNLSGQRVNKAQKGIYIINGKKVLK